MGFQVDLCCYVGRSSGPEAGDALLICAVAIGTVKYRWTIRELVERGRQLEELGEGEQTYT